MQKEQRYCKPACRQKAYRQRHKPKVRVTSTNAAIPQVCPHCNESYWAKTARSEFCSPSCRVLAYRQRKETAVDVVMVISGINRERACDVIETVGMRRITSLLSSAGYSYDYTAKRWLNYSLAA
jgi:hypothetical protein